MNEPIILILIDGVAIREPRDRGNASCLDFIPREGELIEYHFFDESNYKIRNGETIRLKVVAILYKTREDYNGLYKDKVVELHCELFK